MDYKNAGLSIIKKLNKNGFSAYFVGGFVRDCIMDVKINDIDITTSATPEDIEKIFPNTKKKGEKYLSIIVLVDGYEFEITTYRRDCGYLDNRHPDVEAVQSIDEDLLRRDFTINALAMDMDGYIIDLFDGRADIEKKLIRTIGDPKRRFEEDALRILRAFYFAAKLNYTIESNTLEAIKEKASLVSKLSTDRIYQELTKIMNQVHFKVGVKYLFETNVIDYIKELDVAIDALYHSNVTEFDMIDLLSLAMYYGSSLSGYNIPKVIKNKAELISKSIDCYSVMDKHFLARFDLDTLIRMNKISSIVFKTNIEKKELINKYNNLPIHKIEEIDVSIDDLLEIKAEKGPWINEMLICIYYGIIDCKIQNDKKEILQYVKECLKK